MSQLNFRRTVSALSEDYEIKRSLENGIIKEIIVHFPPGCNSLVEVRVYHGSTQILPEKDGVALDNATPIFMIERKVNVGDPVRVEWINHDDSFEHTVSIIIGIISKV